VTIQTGHNDPENTPLWAYSIMRKLEELTVIDLPSFIHSKDRTKAAKCKNASPYPDHSPFGVICHALTGTYLLKPFY